VFDKKSKLLTIKNWWWEEGILPNDRLENALKRCLGDFLVYLEANGISYSKTLLKKGGLDWLKSFD
jgi:hypothetical protein